ncbi:MAG TPA: hypothetical protein VGK58_15440 [Lacipirellulaceae bacterium]
MIRPARQPFAFRSASIGFKFRDRNITNHRPPQHRGLHFECLEDRQLLTVGTFSGYGDFGQNGSVDAADYVIWRKLNGTSGLAPFSQADGTGDGKIDEEDLRVWRSHFGEQLPAPTWVFVPPIPPITATNPVQTVRVIVLNFEPTVPSQGNQKLWEVFGWNDPRELAAGFLNDVEYASGGAINYEIVEWRDLNEFPIFEDGTRYTADQYVQNRMTNTGWSTSTADFYAIAEQQDLAELVNNNVIDEIWAFGDHYFSLFGEAWMAGPQSFFINGPSFPDFDVDRAVAGFGFNYERGVAEMIHNLGHRTENHGSRAYSGWNIVNPATPWDYFTANVGQSNRAAFGVGSTHYPMNGVTDYDTSNTGVVNSYAEEFVLNFPNQNYANVRPLSRDAWGDLGIGNWERGYQRWFFSHVPRSDGTAPDGRQNNWYKYIYDYNTYKPNTGLPRDNEAILGATTLEETGLASYDFTLRYYDVQGIDTTSLDNTDVLVTGPNGYSQLATLVNVGPQQATTAGTARTVRYRVTSPSGPWDSDDSGSYTASLRANQVRDTTGVFLPSAVLGSFQISIPNAAAIDVGSMLAEGEASVVATTWDIGSPLAIFDGNPTSLYRTQNINPAVVTLTSNAPLTVDGFRVYFLGGTHNWTVESANSLADLNGRTGSYRLLTSVSATPSDMFAQVSLPAAVSATHFRLTAQRLTGDNYVHITSWDLLGASGSDVASPTAALLSTLPEVTGGSTTSFIVRYSDDRAVMNRSINYGDVQVTGPNGFVQTAAFYGVDVNANGPTRDVTYFVSAPGGRWDHLENGAYAIHIVADQVFDVSGKPVAAVTIGSFTVNVPPIQTRPPDDMTELNASDWFAFAVAATAETSDDTARKTLGASSVRFDTTGGFDTFLRYEPASGTLWDLTNADQFHFDVYAENPSAFDFQQEPIVRFIDVDGDAMEFRYWRNNSPHPLWNNAIGTWLSQAIFVKSSGQPQTGWRGTAIGTPDWSRMSTVEIHADTWDSGFTLWFDRMGFNLPASGAPASLAASSFVNEDVDAFFTELDRSAPTAPSAKTSRLRGIFSDLSPRHAAILAWLAAGNFVAGERTSDAELVVLRPSTLDEDWNYEDMDMVFQNLVSERIACP